MSQDFPAHPAVQALDGLLGDLILLLGDIGDGEYSRVEARVFRSSVGGHVRHLLDHVRALLDGVGGGERIVRYDRRERGTSVETSREAARIEAGDLRERLIALEATFTATDRPERGGRDALSPVLLTVEQIVDPARPPVYVRSNLLREIVFVMHHGLHHAALIAARLRSEGRELPAAFGVAPATLSAGS